MTRNEEENMPTDEEIKPAADQVAMEGEAPPPPPELPLEWAYFDNDAIGDRGAASCVVEDKRLYFKCTSGPPFDVPYATIDAIEDSAVTITLAMRRGGKMELTKMARLHDMFLAALMEKWKRVNRRQALAEESQLAAFSGKAGRAGQAMRPAGIGIYETAVVLDFGNGEVARIPLIFSGRPQEENRTFTFTPPGEQWNVGFMGRETDLFRQTAEQAVSALESKAQGRIRALYPQMPPFKLRPLVGRFLDGLAVPVKAVREAWPALADAMVGELGQAGLGDSWEACLSIGLADGARIGAKEALKASDGLYRWFFVPVVRGERAAVIMEASSEGATGRATYVFHVPEGSAAIEAAMDSLNYGLVMVNFRREPIYMSDEQMKKPNNEHYMRSVERVPALAALRRNYAGRVAHTSPDAWSKALEDILNAL